RSRPDRARDGPRGGWFPRCKAPGVSVTGQALEGTQRQDDQHEQRGPDQKRLAPAERGHEGLAQREEAEGEEGRPELSGGGTARGKAPVLAATGQAREGTQRQDDQHEQRGPDQKRLAPAERGHERLPQRDEAERAEARPEIGDGDRAPARSGVPERGEDQVRL